MRTPLIPISVTTGGRSGSIASWAPAAGLWVLLAVYLLRPADVWPWLLPWSLGKLAFAAACLGAVAGHLGGARFCWRGRLGWLLAAMALWSFVSSLGAVDRQVASSGVLGWCKILAVVLLTRNALGGPRQAMATLGWMLGCVTILALAAVWQYLTGRHEGPRIQVLLGQYSNPNDLSVLLCAVTPFALAATTGAWNRRGLRLGAAVVSVILFAGVCATQSKGGTLALILAVVLMALRHRKAGPIWLAAGLAVFWGLPYLGEALFHHSTRFQPMYYRAQDDSTVKTASRDVSDSVLKTAMPTPSWQGRHDSLHPDRSGSAGTSTASVTPEPASVQSVLATPTPVSATSPPRPSPVPAAKRLRPVVDRSSPGVRHRILLLLDSREKSMAGRLLFWRRGFFIALQRPWLGAGPGCFIQAYRQAAGHDALPADLQARSAHSSYLQVAVELGLPGLLLFVTLVVSPWLDLRRCGATPLDPGFQALLHAARTCVLVLVLQIGIVDHADNWGLYLFLALAEAIAHLLRANPHLPPGDQWGGQR